MRLEDWISVKDRLPNHGDIVLIVFGANQIVAMARYFNKYGGPNWLDMPGTNEYKPDFWMPLPEPPTKPDPFETWWETIRQGRMAKVTGVLSWLCKDEAKQVWDAALKSKE